MNDSPENETRLIGGLFPENYLFVLEIFDVRINEEGE